MGCNLQGEDRQPPIGEASEEDEETDENGSIIGRYKNLQKIYINVY